MKVVIKKSDRPGKKLMAIFTKDTGRTKTTYFGKAGMDDYTLTKDKEQRTRYRQRHKKDLKTNDPTRAGYLSYHILDDPVCVLAPNFGEEAIVAASF